VRVRELAGDPVDDVTVAVARPQRPDRARPTGAAASSATLSMLMVSSVAP